MHILLTICSLEAGGAQRAISELANHFCKTNQISILTLAPLESDPFYPLNSTIFLKQLNLPHAGLNCLVRFSNTIRRVVRLRKTIKTLKPDIIISFIDMMNVMTLLSSIGLKIPVIVSERIDPHFHPLPRLYKLLRSLTYPFASTVVVQTKNAKKYFPSSLACKIMPNTIIKQKKEKNEYKQKSEYFNIVTVGRLADQKDHETLIRAVGRIREDFSNIMLTIYGEGEKRPYLEKLVKSLALQDKVLLPGIEIDVFRKLKEADLFIFPSKYEGFPNALAEAMSIGLPVIASNCSGNTDLVQDNENGLLFPIGRVESLANQIKLLVKDTKLREKIGISAKKISTKYSKELIIGKWEALLEDLN